MGRPTWGIVPTEAPGGGLSWLASSAKLLSGGQPHVKQEARNTIAYPLALIGVIRSTLGTRREAPKQGGEGAPDAWLEGIF